MLDAIAVALDGRFIAGRVDDPSTGYILIDGATETDQGPGLWLRRDGISSQGRLQVSGVYPRTMAGELVLPPYVLPYDQREKHLREITISTQKPVDRIAREIGRRFLPEYQRLYGLCRAYVDERDARIVRHISARDRLASLVPGATTDQAWRNRSERSRMIRIHPMYGEPSGEVEVAHEGDHVQRIELHNLSIDDTEWILRFLYEGRRRAAVVDDA